MANPSRYRIPPHVVSQGLGEETVVLDSNSGDFFALNPTGARAWQLFREGADLTDIVQRLKGEFDVTLIELGTDIEKLFAELERRGLVERVSD